MQSINIGSYQDYLKYLQSHDDEWMALLDTVLINFTSFFRDRDTWDYLANNIIPKIIACKQANEPIRVWSAGCASGQEVYSLVMLFAEALGIDDCLQRVQFYATDVDEAAVRQARQATYSTLEIIGIPPDWLEKYFEKTKSGYVFDRKLRSKIVFGHHNLAENAPMSKIDLLTCRNVLIYFDVEAQAVILARFHFALKRNGFLFLGKSETPINRKAIFTPVNYYHQVFAKGLDLDLEDHLRINPRSSNKQAIEPMTTKNYICQTLFEASPFAQLAIDSKGCLLMANKQANVLFGLTLDHQGRSIQELEVGRLVNLSSLLPQVYWNRHPVTLRNIARATEKGTKYFDIAIAPVFKQNRDLIAVNLTFIDITGKQQLEDQLKSANLELAKLSETLKQTEAAATSTHAQLESTQLELETVNQEMQFIERDLHR
jgi:two-component system CheB/CheR fusion protein